MACIAQQVSKSAFIHATSHNAERTYWVPGTQNHNKNILVYFFKIKSQTEVMHQLQQLLKTDLEKLINITQSWLR